MPMRARYGSRPRGGGGGASTPSIRICPPSGARVPMVPFSITRLPGAEPPITTTDSPRSTTRSSPFSTCFGPKLLCTSLSSILGTSGIGRLVSGEEQAGDQVVEHQDHDGRRDHGVGRRGTHALGAALRLVAVIAAHQRNDEAENGGLHQTGDDVHRLEILPGPGQVAGGVEVQPVDADQEAAE